MTKEVCMDIIISNSSSKPIYEQIISQMKGLILSGAIAAGDALPSIRFLAKELRISVITTKRAYEELEQEGFIVTIPGKGSFVSEKNTEFVREEQLRKMEEHLLGAIHCGKESGMQLEDMQNALRTLFEEV